MDRPHDTALENRPSSNQLLVDKSGRKPLFASANSRDGGTRDDAAQQTRPATGRRYQPPIDGLTNRSRYEPPTPSSAARDARQARPTSSASRVPQAKGSSISHRKPLSMTEAYRLAEQEEDASGGDDDGEPMAGSPSPAPRTWRSRFNSQMKATEAGRELAKVTRGEIRGPDVGAEGRSRPSDGQYDYAGGEDVALPPLGPGIDDSPLPSPGPKDGLASPMKGLNTSASPQKSFAWDIDQDFTAGDLQVSDSPRIRVDERPFANRRAFDDNSEIDLNSPMRLNPPGSRNTKLDEIRVLERRAGDVQSLDLVSPRKNTKLDEIAAREASAESQIPIPERKLSTPRNNKLAEIRQRELEGLSKRQLASLRLGEIREQNSMARSRFEDFEPQLVKGSSEGRDTESKTEADVPARPKSAYEPARETKANTNMAFQSRQKGGRELSRSLEDQNWRTTSEPVRPSMSHNRKSSTDVLRGANPSSTSAQRRTLSNTTSEKTSDSSDTKSRFAKRAARNGRKQNKDGAGDNKRLTVGFAGLKRVQSTESTNSKRSSMHSEPDPTERLEAELKLFAPTDNYSEPGSVRAQSPASESDDEKMAEATPKPKRQDPLLMPTPKVTGAYVETPATVRVEKIAPEETKTDSIPAETSDDRPTRATMGDRRRSSSWSSADRYISSDPGAGERQSADVGSAAEKKPRSRSLPRRRPPIRNTAKLPSVKDDLLELHRLHNVEDSTLDNLEEILTGQKPAPPSITEEFKKHDNIDSADEETTLEDLKRLGKHEPESPKRSTVVKSKPFKEETPDADDLATYDRMSKSLQTVSLSIHDAKKGIEKLEDRFTSAQTEKPHAMAAETDMHDSHHRPAHTARPETSAMAYIQIPVPRLFYREPSFRFTLLGLIFFITSLWYAAETAMCANFCRPYYCDPSSGPCVWSFDDPTSFGTALPIKVDQWVTGGYGRKRFEAIYEILDDAKEDLVDAALGRHITDVDANMLPTPEKRRQHRRRLRNKGLVKRKSIEDASPEDREKWAAWRRARLASERAKEAREMGYAWEEEDGSIGGDVPVA